MTQAQRTLNNRYELQAKVGDGGMAVVYRALDTQLNRIVAIKILRDTYASDPGFLARFKREAQSAAGLSHPNIVNVYDVGQDGDLNYIVMEYVDGGNLKEVINREAPLPTGQALEFAAQICDAIGYAHSRNLIHRDIKPQNILIDKSGRVKVADFGIAKGQGDMTLTQTGVTLGTVHYFSPEQAKGLPATPQSDLYSIGVVLYEMLTGRIPFESDNPVALALKHLEEPPPPPRRFNPNIPPDLEQIVLKSLSKNPTQRYANAAAFAQILRNFESQAQGATSVVPRSPQPNPNAPRRSPLMPPPADQIYTEANQQRMRQPQTYDQQSYINNPPPVNRQPAYPPAYEDEFDAPRRPSRPYDPRQQSRNYRPEPPVVADYEERRGPGCGAWFLGAAALAILLGVVLFVVAVLVPQLNNAANPTATVGPVAAPTATTAAKGKVAVPNVVNQTQQDAEKNIKAANLLVGDTKQEFKEGVDAGKVLRQDPAPNTQVDQQTKINLVISKGQDLVSLPFSYANTDPAAAKQALEGQGFRVEVVQEPSANVQSGAVTRIDPVSGPDVKVAKGSLIKLYVSTGPLPTATPQPTATPVPQPTATAVPPTATKTTRKVQVPTIDEVRGLEQQAVVNKLAQLGLKARIEQWDEAEIKRRFPNDPNALPLYNSLKVGQVIGIDSGGQAVIDEGSTITVAVKK